MFYVSDGENNGTLRWKQFLVRILTPKDQKIPMGGVATYRTFHFMKIFDLIDLVSCVRSPKMMVQAVQYQKRSFLDLSGFRKYTRGPMGVLLLTANLIK